MRGLLLLWGLATCLTGVAAQTPDWGRTTPVDAETSARAQGKPVLLLWQTGPGAAAFTQGVERVFAAWPAWAAQASTVAVFTRGRSWEGPLPASYPPLPDPKASALVLWVPGSPRNPTVWTSPPPVLELSNRLAEASGAPLPPPYTLGVTGYSWDDWTLTRVDQGPLWTATGPEGPSVWVEEGPLGTVLVLNQPQTGRRAAFPLEGEWSFLYDPDAQSWSAWNPVLVKRP